MLKCISKITITNQDTNKPLSLDFITDVDVKTSYDKMTNTATVVFPRNINYEGENIFTGRNALFRRKDRIKIELGYSPKLRTIFEGYITKIGASNPIKIECEDLMFSLKNSKITFPNKTGVITTSNSGRVLKTPITVTSNVTLSQLMDYIMPNDINYSIIVSNSTGTGVLNDVNLGKFTATNVSITEILDTLRSDYGLYSYFQNNVLYVGLPINASSSNTEEFAFEETIIDGNDLEYQQADDLNLKVVAISMQSDNTKKQIEIGDNDGSQRTYYTYNSTDDELKVFANLKLKEIKYTGYNGKFMTFGEPHVKHGDIAKITSKKYPEQDGYYTIVGVDYKMSVDDGYKQTIDIGRFVGSAISDVNNFKLKGS